VDTLNFGTDGRLHGQATCNRYTSRYELTGTRLTIVSTAVTNRACAPALMDQERRFLDVMGRAATCSMTPDGALIIATPDGATITARPVRAAP
jgi:putative lipoprotein